MLVAGLGWREFRKIVVNAFSFHWLPMRTRQFLLRHLILRMSVFTGPTSHGAWFQNVQEPGTFFAATLRLCSIRRHPAELRERCPAG
jgi:hypothetical protein